MSPDQHNQFPSYYTKGGIVALLLDLLIITQSNGKSKLDHALRTMWKSYKQDGTKGFTEDEIIQCIEEECGVSIRSVFTQWLNGTDELPYQEIFSRIGLEWKEEPIAIKQEWYGDFRPFHPKKQSIFFGCAVNEEQGKVIVKEVEKNSPADRGGIGIDDEIIAVNGKRISNRNMLLQSLQSNGLTQDAEIIANCDGKIYTTSITLQPAIQYSLNVRDSITHDQEQLLEFWLHG